VILYLDASALVKLVVAEAESDVVTRVWWEASLRSSASLSWVEVHSAVARRRRRRELSQSQARRARLAWATIWRGLSVIEPAPVVLRVAAQSTHRYGLGALDAVHLASFFAVLAKAEGGEARFCGYDRKLLAAVERASRRIVRGGRRAAR
jgi:predicted nucleic acid-binding protein